MTCWSRKKKSRSQRAGAKNNPDLHSMKLLIHFTDQSASFAHGVEFGRLLGKMERGDLAIQNNGFPVHVENIQVLKDACNTYGYIPTFGTEQHGWIEFTGVKKVASEN